MNTRIYLEKLQPQDFESFYTLTGNEQVMVMITERPLSEEEARDKFNYFLENNEVAESDPDLTRVYAITDPNNTASRKILINNGFTSEEVGVVDGLPSEVFGRQVN